MKTLLFTVALVAAIGWAKLNARHDGRVPDHFTTVEGRSVWLVADGGIHVEDMK